MPEKPTTEELLKLWNKVQKDKVKGRQQGKVRSKAIKRLVAAHEDEFAKLLNQAWTEESE